MSRLDTLLDLFITEKTMDNTRQTKSLPGYFMRILQSPFQNNNSFYNKACRGVRSSDKSMIRL